MQLKLHGVVAGDEFEGTIENPELLMEVSHVVPHHVMTQ